MANGDGDDGLKARVRAKFPHFLPSASHSALSTMLHFAQQKQDQPTICPPSYLRNPKYLGDEGSSATTLVLTHQSFGRWMAGCVECFEKLQQARKHFHLLVLI